MSALFSERLFLGKFYVNLGNNVKNLTYVMHNVKQINAY